MGHVDQCVKFHIEVKDKNLRYRSGISYTNNKLMYAIADGTTPAEDTHIVAFRGQHNHFQPDEDINVTMGAMQSLTPMGNERLVSVQHI